MSKYNFSKNIRLKKEVKELIEELRKFDEDIILRKSNSHYVAVTPTETPYRSFKNQKELKGWLLAELRYKRIQKGISKNKFGIMSFSIRRFWGDYYLDALESLTEKQVEKIIDIAENYNHRTVECIVDGKRIYVTHTIYKDLLEITID